MFTAGPESDFAITPEWLSFKEMVERRKPGLVIVDGVTLVYEGPEGKRALVTRVMRSFDEVAREHGCSIVVLGHNNKEGEFSGSTAFENAVRARMSLGRIETEEGEDAVCLSLPKANYNGKQQIRMRFAHGVLVGIDDQHMTGAEKLERDMRRSQAEARFMEGVDKITDQGRTLSAAARASNYAPKLIRKEYCPAFTVKEFAAAMGRLIEEAASPRVWCCRSGVPAAR
jgi:AAA domain